MGETIRVEHSKDYTVISNLAIRDVRLSLRARGLHHLLLSYPNGWKINIDHLTGESQIEGREAIATALGELEKLGYLTRTQKRIGGKFSGYESVIRELPIKNPPQPKGRRNKKKQESPETAQPETAQPETAQPETAQPEAANPVDIKYLFNKVINQELSSEEVSIPPNPQSQNGEKGEEKSQPVADEILESGSALDQICFPNQQKPGSLPETENLPLGQSSAAPLATIETTADRVRRVYQETGILPSIPMEIEELAHEDLGTEIIALYRKSGRIATTKRGDINPSFAIYVAAQWTGKDIDYGYAKIRKMERDPQQWEVLASMVAKWQASIHASNQEVNLVQEINKQERQGPPTVNFGGRRI